MIKLSSETPDGPVFLFGLSRGNIERLLDNKPIKIDLSTMGGPKIRIGIFFGETEKDMYEELCDHGLITDETEIIEE